ASLSRFKLATVSGASGTTVVDDTGGPVIDGFVRPGLVSSLDRAGTVTWSFQLNRDGLDLQEGQPYTISFWGRADKPRRISVNLWQDRQPNRFGGFTGYADLTTDWQQFSFVFRPSNPDPEHSRLSWNFGNSTGVVALGEIALQAGGVIAAPTEWTLARGVPLIDYKTTQVSVVRRDYAEFLGSIEAGHVASMRRFLREDLGIRVPIWHSQAQFGGWGGLVREMAGDAIDVHAYWKHPDFGGAGWSGTNWKVGNASMAGAGGVDPLTAFSFFRAPGKPFVMSEWNSGQPNDYGAESLLMIASYAAWQDWAGVFLFDYHSSGPYDRNRIEGFFSIDSHPTKMVTAPAAALLFRRAGTGPSEGDLMLAENATTLKLPRAMLWDEVASLGDGPTATPIIKTWRDAGASRSAPLEGKVYSLFGNGVFPVASRSEIRTEKVWNSDTQQVRWDTFGSIYAVNAPRSKVAIGQVGGRKIDLDELQLTVEPSQSNFAAFSLSSLDGKPVVDSRSILLVAAGKAENVGMGWNADRSSVGTQWGSGPVQVEGIGSAVQLVTTAKRSRVWALDVTGQQRSEVASELKNGVLSFRIAPGLRTLWYQIDNS
ncbi:MAG TPA: carbohydrate binding domain-containing protein, partial [Abditibacteriaceae bacterium]